MTEPNPLAPKPPKQRPVTTIIDNEMPKRLIVQLDTHGISPGQYEAAVAGWLESVSPPSLAFLVARALLAGIKSAR
ncbi:MAG: hypothetical protein KA170_03775 [Candidatus Promineofilum sp.]|nr:hypothetical protein [Promineifilum sp.]